MRPACFVVFLMLIFTIKTPANALNCPNNEVSYAYFKVCTNSEIPDPNGGTMTIGVEQGWMKEWCTIGGSMNSVEWQLVLYWSYPGGCPE